MREKMKKMRLCMNNKHSLMVQLVFAGARNLKVD